MLPGIPRFVVPNLTTPIQRADPSTCIPGRSHRTGGFRFVPKQGPCRRIGLACGSCRPGVKTWEQDGKKFRSEGSRPRPSNCAPPNCVTANSTLVRNHPRWPLALCGAEPLEWRSRTSTGRWLRKRRRRAGHARSESSDTGTRRGCRISGKMIGRRKGRARLLPSRTSLRAHGREIQVAKMVKK